MVLERCYAEYTEDVGKTNADTNSIQFSIYIYINIKLISVFAHVRVLHTDNGQKNWSKKIIHSCGDGSCEQIIL